MSGVSCCIYFFNFCFFILSDIGAYDKICGGVPAIPVLLLGGPSYPGDALGVMTGLKLLCPAPSLIFSLSIHSDLTSFALPLSNYSERFLLIHTLSPVLFAFTLLEWSLN